ncbi:MAG: PH domain-containing protein [Planctomycetales bacterium]|nr:PH domain-containing protein [Planctomycetales bacterium]
MSQTRVQPKQAIAGVTPAQVAEATVMTIWPSICAYSSGRFLGTLYEIRFPDINRAMRLGNLIALLSVPHALLLYFWKVLPWVAMKYTLTNRRVVVQRGIQGVEERSVKLDAFDAIDVVVQDGQAWFKAGDLLFKNGQREVFRLAGVNRPEAFRAACLKAHIAYVGVQKALARSH